MTARKYREAGQALPVYITVVAGLLFLAFAYFVIGQAAAARNGAQSAADAAALAAAQEAREQLHGGLLGAAGPADWEKPLGGERFGTAGACREARYFAARNGAEVLPDGCQRLTDGRVGFTVEVRTREPLGETVVPGTEDIRMTATATAVVEPRCSFEPEEGGPKDGGDRGGGGGADRTALPGVLTCDGRSMAIDPREPDLFPEARDLFTVRLSD